MSKISLIIRQEYLSRIRKRSFVIMTLLMPFLFAGLMFVPYWLSGINESGTQKITVLDYTGLYKNLFTDTPQYQFYYQTSGKPGDNTDIPYAYITISENLLEKPEAIAIYSEKQVSQNFKEYITLQTERYLENEKLASYQIPNIREIIADSQIKLDIPTIRLDDNGTESRASAETSILVGTTSTFFIYLFLLLYGVQVMQSVTQEKSSRIVEILVSSVKPFELMMGKIIAIGLTGLTQFSVWIILSAIFVTSAIAPFSQNMPVNTGELSTESITQIQTSAANFPFAELLICFVLFFIGGYMLYASLFAAIGSTIDNESDTQQFMAPVTIIILFALYAGIYSAQNPEGPLAFWCSMIPFTSPIVMMVRIPFGIPLWEIALSLSVLVASALCSIWLSGKIYRTGILMYGKKVTYKELKKWLRYKT